GGHEVQCNHCGARSVTAQHAERCPFCDASLVVDLPPGADTIVPDAVAPFGIARDEAGARFVKWLASRWFAPRDLIARARRDGLDGVYLPYWLYDAQTSTRYTGARGEYY